MGLLLGFLSLVPLPVFGLTSLVVNAIALVKSKAPERRDQRWKPTVGLSLTLLSGCIYAYSYLT